MHPTPFSLLLLLTVGVTHSLLTATRRRSAQTTDQPRLLWSLDNDTMACEVLAVAVAVVPAASGPPPPLRAHKVVFVVDSVDNRHRPKNRLLFVQEEDLFACTLSHRAFGACGQLGARDGTEALLGPPKETIPFVVQCLAGCVCSYRRGGQFMGNLTKAPRRLLFSGEI